jgi:hypothetical protein
MKSRTKAPQETLLINRLAKLTNDPLVQSAGPDVVIGIGRHEDRRNCIARIDEVSVELESGHRGHVDVGDQASGFGEVREARKSLADGKVSTLKPSDLMSRLMDSRKN